MAETYPNISPELLAFVRERHFATCRALTQVLKRTLPYVLAQADDAPDAPDAARDASALHTAIESMLAALPKELTR